MTLPPQQVHSLLGNGRRMIQSEMVACSQAFGDCPAFSTRPRRARRSCLGAVCKPVEVDSMFDLASLAFWVIAFVLIGSALAVVLLRNIVHAALSLALVFAAAAGV